MSNPTNQTLSEFYHDLLKHQPLSHAPEAVQKRIQNLLRLDDLNFSYFLALHEKWRENGKTRSQSKQWKFYKVPDESVSSGNCESSEYIIYPYSNAPKEYAEMIPVSSYQELVNKNDMSEKALSKEAALWVMPMQAGLGTSIKRSKYLSELLSLEESKVPLGPKGTDLYITIGEERVSLAEIQILRVMEEVKRGDWGHIHFSDIVSGDTGKSMNLIWEKRSPLLPNGRSYEEAVDDSKLMTRFDRIYQSLLPTFNQSGEITLNRTAPGGHALFGLAVIRAALFEKERPSDILDTKGVSLPLVAVLSNGEDLSGMPDPLMVGHMLAKEIPIYMVTTEKSEIDLKGGQLGICEKIKNSKNEKNTKSTAWITIIEKAQAKECNEEKLFEELGLREGDRKALFNTNMAIFNFKALIPKLEKLKELSQSDSQSLLSQIAPDLIENWKEQKSDEDKMEKYLQLEGAMGSVLLNLDRLYRFHFGEHLVHFINVEREYRGNFFSPIKSAFDFYMQFYSDRFTFDLNLKKLKNNNPKFLPSIHFSNPYYDEVANVLKAFKDCKILHLKELHINGIFDCSGLELKGVVSLIQMDEQGMQDKNSIISLSTLLRKEGIPLVLENSELKCEYKSTGVYSIQKKNL